MIREPIPNNVLLCTTSWDLNLDFSSLTEHFLFLSYLICRSKKLNNNLLYYKIYLWAWKSNSLVFIVCLCVSVCLFVSLSLCLCFSRFSFRKTRCKIFAPDTSDNLILGSGLAREQLYVTAATVRPNVTWPAASSNLHLALYTKLKFTINTTLCKAQIYIFRNVR